tara:strand:+ start:509 stop:1249 length:741 start_codon:yes stop_codon:yes gene_type:complete
MADWEKETREDYKLKGFAASCGYGSSPALLVVDFINGFTDPSTPLGGDFSSEIAVAQELLSAFRGASLPIVFTTIAYEAHYRDAGMWIRKVPSLEILRKGTSMVEIDDRVHPQAGEYVLEKKFASSFFKTDLESHLNARGIDTVIMIGCTTSGCVRATAIDSISSGFHTIVVAEATGDRAEGPHEANLFDIEAKYGDVVSLREATDYLKTITSAGGYAQKVQDDFQRWWNDPSANVLSIRATGKGS